MSIILTPVTPSLETRAFIAFEGTFLCTKKSTTESEDCVFELLNCDNPVPQFIDLTDIGDVFKNDIFSFISEVQTGQTIELEIENCVNGVITAVTASNLGTFKDVGFYGTRPRVWTFVFDWHKVHALFGFGYYVLRETTKSAGGNTVSIIESPCFRLLQFECDDAHDTVRIETIQTGHIHNGFDYRGINFETTSGIFATQVKGWKQQIRWYGTFTPEIPDEENDFIQDANRIERQVQSKVTEKFKLSLKFFASNVGKQITRDNFLADTILITDYNLSNYEFYRDRNVRKISTDSLDRFPMQKNIWMSWTFKDVDEGTIKRRF